MIFFNKPLSWNVGELFQDEFFNDAAFQLFFNRVRSNDAVGERGIFNTTKWIFRTKAKRRECQK